MFKQKQKTTKVGKRRNYRFVPKWSSVPLTVAVHLLQARLGPKLQQAQPGSRRGEEQAAHQPVQNRLGGQPGVHRRADVPPMAHRRQSTSADQVRMDSGSPCLRICNELIHVA